MAVPSGIIFIWTGTHAGIPTGYTRETSLDGKYTKGEVGTGDPNVTGGAATHTHTSPGHTHAIAAHAHQYDLASAGVTTLGVQAGVGTMIDTHTHSGTSGPVSDGVTGSTAVTYGSASNDPPYYEVIFIKSNGSVGVPNNVIGLFEGATAPSDWIFCDGTSSTPDLRNLYLKGAAAAADAGGTGGGTTNTHDISHAHSAGSHGHSAASSSASPSEKRGINTGANRPFATHVHDVTLDATSVAIPDFSGSLVTTETVEPAYHKLAALQNQVGTHSKPQGIIGMWLGLRDDIPPGWQEVTSMRDKHLKIAATMGEIGNEGGSNTHGHASQSHTHPAASSHTHTGFSSVHENNNNAQEDANPTHATQGGSQHPVINIAPDNPSYQSAATTADSSNNEPPYRTVIYLKFIRDVFVGCIL